MVKIGTHNGAFHCDEALACAMLKRLPAYKEAEIVRTRDPKILDTCDIVVDVGGTFDPAKHRYDHHQKTFKESMSTVMPGKPWVTKLSSAGLVYAHFGKQLIAQMLKEMCNSSDEVLVDKIFDKVYENLLEEVDAIDNGIATHDGDARYAVTTGLGSRVGYLRPAWNDKVQDFDAGFAKAVDLVWSEFEERVRFYTLVWWPAREVVKKALEGRFEVHALGRILLLDQGGCPFSEHLYELEEEEGVKGQVLFVLFTDPNGSWRVRAVSLKDQPFTNRLQLKDEWCGLRDQELSDKAGIPDCVFVHASGFIGGNKTKEGALKMAAETIKAAGIV